MGTKVIDTKQLGGHAVEVKEEERDGVKIGIISGYIATWDIDRGGFLHKDQFTRGAWSESIESFKSKRRMPRFKDMHGRTIGGWRFETLREDEKGLFGDAEVNLDVQQGREAYMMAKQGVLTDLSVGFTADDFSIDEDAKLRTISKATLWEGSIVDEPMNPKAKITGVKNATRIEDLSKINIREFEKLLINGVSMGSKNAKIITSYVKECLLRDEKGTVDRDGDSMDWGKVVQSIKNIKMEK